MGPRQTLSSELRTAVVALLGVSLCVLSGEPSAGSRQGGARLRAALSPLGAQKTHRASEVALQ